MNTLLLMLCLTPAGGPPVFNPPAVRPEPPAVAIERMTAPEPKMVEKKEEEPSVRRLQNARTELTYKGRTWTTEPNASETFVSQLKQQLKEEADGKPVIASRSVTQLSSYVDAPGTHRHKCLMDGTVWTHPDRSLDEHAHDCPKCGRQQLDKYRGPDPPTVLEAKPKDLFQFLNLNKTTEPLTIVRTFRSNGVVYQELSDGTIRTCPNCPYAAPSYSRKSR